MENNDAQEHTSFNEMKVKFEVKKIQGQGSWSLQHKYLFLLFQCPTTQMQH